MKSVAITGATGFVGRHLVARCLASGCKVRILSRSELNARRILAPGCEVVEGDLASESCPFGLFLDGVDVLYHCAAELKNPSLMAFLHQDGTRRLAEAARGCVSRFVQLSSVGVYGSRRTGLIDENTLERPEGVYEQTKTVADGIVKQVLDGSSTGYVILRPTTIFGSDMPNNSLRRLVSTIKRGVFFFVGDPVNTAANYIHVDNVIDALLLCGEDRAAIGQSYILSDDITMREFVDVISMALEHRQIKLSVPRCVALPAGAILGCLPGSPLNMRVVRAITSRRWYSSNRIKTQLRYSCSVRTGDGIADFVKQAGV